MTNTPGDQPTPSEQEPGRGPQGEPERVTQSWPAAAPYGHPYPPPGHPGGTAHYAPDHPRATTVLVLGLLGVVLCQVLGPFAWAMGKKALNEIDASGGRIGGRGQVQAGYVLGIVGTVLLGLSVLLLGVYAVFMVALVGGVATAA
jgi:hypothetical protein